MTYKPRCGSCLPAQGWWCAGVMLSYSQPMESWQRSDRFCRQMSWPIWLQASPRQCCLWCFVFCFCFVFLCGGEDSLTCDDRECSPGRLYRISLKDVFVTVITPLSSMFCVHSLEYRWVAFCLRAGWLWPQPLRSVDSAYNLLKGNCRSTALLVLPWKREEVIM